MINTYLQEGKSLFFFPQILRKLGWEEKRLDKLYSSANTRPKWPRLKTPKATLVCVTHQPSPLTSCILGFVLKMSKAISSVSSTGCKCKINHYCGFGATEQKDGQRDAAAILPL